MSMRFSGSPPTRTGNTYIVSASNAPSRVQKRADYICDGTADDVEIQDALDSLVSGGCVYLTEGTYDITSDILLDDDQTLFSNGMATLRLLDGAHEENVITVTGKSTVAIYGLTIDGNGANVGETDNVEWERNGINVINSTDVYISNCIIRDCFQNAVYVAKGAARVFVVSNTIRDNNCGVLCYNYDSGGVGTPATNVFVANNILDNNDQFTNTPQVGVYFTGGANFCVAAGNIITNGYDAITVNGVDGTAYNLIANNLIRDHTNSAVWMTTAAHHISIQNNIIEHDVPGSNRAIYATTSGGGCDYLLITGNSIYGSVGNAIDLTVSDHSSILSNKIYDGAATAILINGGYDNLISGNYVWSCGNSGITISAGDRNTITNNACVDNTGYGIYLGSTVVGTLVQGNYMSGNTTAALYPRSGNYINYNIGYIAPGESRYAYGSLTAGAANAICFAWNNPETQDILVKKVVVEVTTAGGTAGSHLDVGIADDATGTNRGVEFFDDLDLNAAQVNDSWVGGDGGQQTKWVFCQDIASAIDDWIVGQILDANANSLVGKYYVEYVGR